MYITNSLNGCCLLNSPQGDGNHKRLKVHNLRPPLLPTQFPARGWKPCSASFKWAFPGHVRLPTQFPARGWKHPQSSVGCLKLNYWSCLLNSPQGDGNKAKPIRISITIHPSCLLNSPQGDGNSSLATAIMDFSSRLLPTQFPARGWKLSWFRVHFRILPPHKVAYSIPRKGMETFQHSILPQSLRTLPTQFPARGWKQKYTFMRICPNFVSCLLNSPQGDGNLRFHSSTWIVFELWLSCLLNSPQGDGNSLFWIL